jgi:hypothetical protein
MDRTRKDKSESGWGRVVRGGRTGEFRTFFASDILPLVIWHRDGRILDANDAYLDLVKYPRRSIGQGALCWNRLTPAEYWASDERAIKELLVGRAVCEPFEKEYFRGDGARIPVLVGGALLPSTRDHGVGFALDLAGCGSGEEALHSQSDNIARLYASVFDERFGEFEDLSLGDNSPATSATPTSGTLLAHEIRQPLGTILANAQAARLLLRQRKPRLKDLKAIVEDIISEDRRASRLIKEFTFSEAGRKGAFAPIEINSIVCEALKSIRHELTRTQVQCEVSLAASLPMIRGDSNQLHELFINLYTNAWQALQQIDPAQRKLFIRSYLESKSWVSIEIRDSGPGISSDHLETIFDPFVTTRKDGVGIGLYICRAIARSHGGRIWATNHSSGGASLYITLPARGRGE